VGKQLPSGCSSSHPTIPHCGSSCWSSFDDKDSLDLYDVQVFFTIRASSVEQAEKQADIIIRDLKVRKDSSSLGLIDVAVTAGSERG
jgi:hypothetical protein